jgi:bacillolysin
MKSTFTVIFLASGLFFQVFGQKSFESKKRKTDTDPKLLPKFETIDGSKKLSNQSFSPILLHGKVLKDQEANGSIYYVENERFASENKHAKKSASAQVFDYLGSISPQTKIKNPKNYFKVVSETSDEKDHKHIKIEQHYKNIPIYGAEAYLHSNDAGVLETLTGRLYPYFDINTDPKFKSNDLIQKALDDLKSKGVVVQKSGALGKFLDLEKDEAQLLIYPKSNQFHLAYEITVRPNMLERWVYTIDAHSAEILDRYNHTCTLDGVFTATARDLANVSRSFKVAQVGNNYFMMDLSRDMFKSNQSKIPTDPVGAIWTINGNNTTTEKLSDNLTQVTSTNINNWNSTAVSAHYNAGVCYEYFKNKFNRNSLNGSGGNIISIINIADDDGKGLDNAFWNGKIMGYGNGRIAFTPLAGALDVAGHEMGHGVIESTSKLEYRNQSGAINESMADVFGVLIDANDWTLGEDIVLKSYFPSGAMRSMENPNQGGKNDNGYQPKNMAQYINLKDIPEEDNGGVHINSGIPNHAFYKFVTSPGMNRAKAEKIYYDATTKYLTRTSKFVDLRLAIVAATGAIHGANSPEVNAAKAAFDFVGITDPGNGGGNNGGGTGSTPPSNTELPVNPGAESLVVYDPVDKTLYSGPFSNNATYRKVSTARGCRSKPSVTDDGTFVYFVGTDKKIYRSDLTKNTVSETTISTDAVWDNVAVSKNGKVLAAISSVEEPFIYVFNLAANPISGKKFKLYNPTYTTGVETGEVKYPDSFEWDYSGEYLIYDAFNQSKSAFTEIEYWDVGILRAWDPIKNNFGDGNIEKMFSNLDEGDNIGNPALSKTNSNIIAFDYFVQNEESFYVLGIDFGKNQNGIGLIAKSDDVGYPDYNKTDKIITYNGTDNSGIEVVYGINLNTSKINPASSTTKPVVYFEDAKWLVWYAAGQRALPTKQAQTINITAITDKFAGNSFDIAASTSSNLNLQFTVVSGDASISGKRVTCGSTPGKVTIRAFQAGDNKFTAAEASTTFCISPGTPSLQDQGANINVVGGTPPFQFYVNNQPVGGQTTARTRAKDLFGQYTVRSVTADGCQSAASNAVGVAALATEPSIELNISPNPVSEVLKVNFPSDNTFVGLDIFDAKGIKQLSSQKSEVNVTDLASGLYVALIKLNNQEVNLKFIKK